MHIKLNTCIQAYTCIFLYPTVRPTCTCIVVYVGRSLSFLLSHSQVFFIEVACISSSLSLLFVASRTSVSLYVHPPICVFFCLPVCLQTESLHLCLYIGLYFCLCLLIYRSVWMYVQMCVYCFGSLRNLCTVNEIRFYTILIQPIRWSVQCADLHLRVVAD